MNFLTILLSKNLKKNSRAEDLNNAGGKNDEINKTTGNRRT